MLNKEIKIGNKTFKFIFKHKPYYEDENTIVMGFPYNMDVENFNKTQIDKIKGYYTFIKFYDDYIEIINDIMANYRTYYMQKDDTTYFSNDFLILFNMLSKEEREPNKFEIEYWDKHRYTTGGETVCTKIHKIKPAHIYKFYPDKIEENLYFKDLENKPNRKRHFEEVLADMRDTVSLIKNLPQKKFLLFSGGADSTLCVIMLQEQNVDFIPVFAKHIPTNSMNYDDTLKVLYSADKLGIELAEIKINTTKHIDTEIIDTMFMDRSITQLFFVVVEELKEKYGEDIVLLNGQAADSILGFGPTEKNIGQFFIRTILNKPFCLLSRLFLMIIKIFRPQCRNLKNVKNIKEYFIAFYDEKFYMPLIDKDKNEKYFNMIKSILNQLCTNFSNKFAKMMYLKIFGFIQGSDNYVNVQNCEKYGFHSIFMFGTPQIIYSTVQNTDYKYEIYHPKSVVYKILKDVFHYEMPNIKKKKNYKKEIKQEKTFRQYEQEVYKNFYNKMNTLEFSEEVKV